MRVAAERYFSEVGVLRKSAEEIDRDLDWLVQQLGPDKNISEIDENEILRLMAVRRGMGNLKTKVWTPISETCLNRYICERLSAIFKRAAITWKVHAPTIDWASVSAQEPEGGNFGREFTQQQDDDLFAKLRPDLHEFMRFVMIHGPRIGHASVMEWSHVDFDAGRWGTFRIRRKTKKPGVHWQTIPLTRTSRGLLSLIHI